MDDNIYSGYIMLPGYLMLANLYKCVDTKVIERKPEQKSN